MSYNTSAGTRTVYTGECHTCQTVNRADNYHEHVMWVNDHIAQTPYASYLYPFLSQKDHKIETYQQKWTAKKC